MTDKKIKYKGTSFEERQAMRKGSVCNQAEEVKKANMAERNLNKAKEFLRRMEEKYELDFGLTEEPKKPKKAEDPYIKKEKKSHSHIKKAPPMQTKSAIHIGLGNEDEVRGSKSTSNNVNGQKQDLKNAIIWSEILAPPLSKRKGR